MAQKQYIKHLYENEEKSLREISRITNLSFQTVQKYAYMDNWNKNNLPNVDPDNHPVLKDYIATIDEWLEDDIRQPRKQRHTISRIYKRLCEEYNFNGCYSRVRRYVNKKKYLMKQSTEGYLPLMQLQAHAQIDFGIFKYIDTFKNEQQAYALTITFPYSNKGYTQVFKSQNQECLLEGMQQIFQYIGGTLVKIKADNMTTAVAKVLIGGQRELSDGFSRFMMHYRFSAEFCNPASGNEKGNVENKVGYSRRNFFVPIPVIEDFDKFNQELFKKCEIDGNRNHYKKKKPINELFKEESKHLLTLPDVEYEVYRYENVRINKYGYISVDNNKYGVTPELNGKNVQVKIYYDKIEIYYEHSFLKAYERSYSRGEEIVDWKQYISVLCRKPGAVEHTKFFEQVPKLWREHLISTKGNERKSALLLLNEIVSNNDEDICNTVINMAKKCGRTDIETLKQCYHNLTSRDDVMIPMKLDVDVPILNYSPNLSVYDNLTGGETYE